MICSEVWRRCWRCRNNYKRRRKKERTVSLTGKQRSYRLGIDTVNTVIFAGGKFSENIGKTFHVGIIFMILLLFPS